MRFVIPGGSGHVGTLVARTLASRGHQVTVLSRRPSARPWKTVAWDGVHLGAWVTEFEDADVLLNLAGRSVDCRYTPTNRAAILDSRVLSTRVVGQAIARARRPPRVWLQASTATIYAHRFDGDNDEAQGHLGGAEIDVPDTWRFSIDVARAWEQALEDAETPQTRKVALRSAMTMSLDEGSVFDTLLRLVRFGLGGRVGDGRQFMSWVHGDDFVRALLFIVGRDDLHGPVNIAAPSPLPQAEFMQALRHAWGMPVGLPTPRRLLEVGTWLLRTESELILKSRRVVPGRLLESGFRFDYERWPEAARDLTSAWRAKRAS